MRIWKLSPLLLLGGLLFAQGFEDVGHLDWVVRDRQFSRNFLSAYIDTLTAMDPMAELEVQETDELRVSVKIDEEGRPHLERIIAKGRSGVLNKLDQHVLARMDSSMVQALLHRQYAWDYLSDIDVSQMRGDIINVFQERNNKQVRDAFWWTHRRVDISVFPRIVIRLNPDWAFSMEFGRPDLALPASACRTLNLGLATEVFKAYITLPATYFNLLKSSNHPLDGSFGGILKFDSPKFGGSVSFQDMSFRNGNRLTDFIDTVDVTYIPFTGQFYYSFTSRIGSPPDQKGFIPLGSLRTQLGFSFLRTSFGHIIPEEEDTTAGKYEEWDATSPLQSVLGLFRFEYASDMNARFFNRYKLAAQINIGLDGFGGVDLLASYTFTEWLAVNLETAFYWKGRTFTRGDNTTYEWKPGAFIVPSISIYF